jgi:hypothetical protein
LSSALSVLVALATGGVESAGAEADADADAEAEAEAEAEAILA